MQIYIYIYILHYITVVTVTFGDCMDPFLQYQMWQPSQHPPIAVAGIVCAKATSFIFNILGV